MYKVDDGKFDLIFTYEMDKQDRENEADSV